MRSNKGLETCSGSGQYRISKKQKGGEGAENPPRGKNHIHYHRYNTKQEARFGLLLRQNSSCPGGVRSACTGRGD